MAAMKPKMAQVIRWPLVRQLLRFAVWLFAPRHRVGVLAIVQNAAGEVLLLEHVFHPTMPWGAPGGWLDRHEDPAAGAVRELFEETGLCGQVETILLATSDTDPSHITMAYLVRTEPGPLTLSSEILSADWFAPEALPPLFPVVREAIHRARQYAPQPV